MLMARTGNYKNLFDPSTGLMRGRLESGEWVQDFNPQFPYYEYMYREANAWQSSFFAPHDVEGLIGLYGSPAAFEEKLDALFSIPWNERYIARNISCFIGQYCHGNQPDHNFPHLYYFVGKPDKSQALLNRIMEKFYGMGEDGLAFCGMDDTGEMSSWYVFNAIGLYTFSPADAEYLVTVPLFDRVDIRLGDGKAFSIVRGGDGSDLARIRCGEKELDGFFVSHQELIEGGELVITTR
jgi:predicted alpha-1,2-mannosidase